MNHSAKKEHHEQARKKHKHEMQTHARELAKRGRSNLPIWFLVAGVFIIAALLIVVSFN